MSGSQNVVLNFKGIHTNNNYYNAPEGSASEAVNVVCDRTDIVEPRRGLKVYGEEDADYTKQLLQYKDTIIKHYGNKLSYDFDDAGTFVDLSGTITEAETGSRIKYVEMNGNLYITTSEGIKKISAVSKSDFPDISIENAGAIKAVDMTVVVDYQTFGFLEPNSKVAYKIVFGKKDINDNLLIGVPSARTVVWNVGSTSTTTIVTAILPSGIDETYFYQLYRTGLSTESDPLEEPADPGDEMYLVLENEITAADILNGYIQTDDITSEDFRRNGTLLYVNPTSGEGVLQANEPPPFAKDITEYKSYMFFANTATVQRLNLAFLTINGIVAGTTEFQITDGTTTSTYTFDGDFETVTYNYNAVGAATDFYNAPITSGLLVSGKQYKVVAYVAGDDFTNVGGTNTTGTVFTASGTTPTTWTNGSTLRMIDTAKYLTLISANDDRKYLVWFKKDADFDAEPSLSGYINIEVDISLLNTADEFMQEAVNTIEGFTTDFNLTLDTTDVGPTANTLTVECSNNGQVSIVPVFTVALATATADGNGFGDEAGDFIIFLPRTTGTNAPDVGVALEQVAKSLVKKVNAHDTLVNAYYLSSSNDIPGQLYLENRDQTAPAFWVNSNGPSTPPNSIFNPTVPTTGSTVISTNEIRPNRIMYSKYQQPEAVPIVNFIDIGPKDRSIKRVIGLRDSLFILKEDSIYRLTGDSPTNFTVAPFDSSVQILAPDTAVVLNNQIYALSTQGVVVITDTGVSVISRPIENQLLAITRSITAYRTASFGLAYESDRAYELWTVRTPNDTVATQCFRYNTFTNVWTKALGSKTCGLVNFRDNKKYMGAGDIKAIEQERKDLVRADHCDREYQKRIQAVGATNYLILDNFDYLAEGDLIQQRQYLTSQQFDRMLRKLDLDVLVPSTDYYSTLQLVAGSNPRTYVVSLAAKLATDLSNTNYTNLIASYTETITGATEAEQTVITLGPHSIQSGRYVEIVGSSTVPSIDGIHEVISADATTITIDFEVTDNSAPATGTVVTDVNNFKDVQTCFNLIAAELNNDANVGFDNYDESEGYMDLEETVTTFNRLSNRIDTKYNQKFFAGECTLYKAIESYITYNPQFFQDPSVQKQVREASLFYEDTNFSKMILGFMTDKSSAEAQVTLTRGGIGDFGQFAWGNVSFGGVNAPIPLRTLVPLEKQRCRFMQVKVTHKVAQEHYALMGASLTFRPYSIRTNR